MGDVLRTAYADHDRIHTYVRIPRHSNNNKQHVARDTMSSQPFRDGYRQQAYNGHMTQGGIEGLQTPNFRVSIAWATVGDVVRTAYRPESVAYRLYIRVSTYRLLPVGSSVDWQ